MFVKLVILVITFHLLLSILIRRYTPIRSRRPIQIILHPKCALRLSHHGRFTRRSVTTPFSALPSMMNGLRLLLIRNSAITRGQGSNTHSRSIQMRAFFLRHIMLYRTHFIRWMRHFLRHMTSMLIIENGHRGMIIRRLCVTLNFRIRHFLRHHTTCRCKRITIRRVRLLLDIHGRRTNHPSAQRTSSSTPRRGNNTSGSSRFSFILWVLSSRFI